MEPTAGHRSRRVRRGQVTSGRLRRPSAAPPTSRRASGAGPALPTTGPSFFLPPSLSSSLPRFCLSAQPLSPPHSFAGLLDRTTHPPPFTLFPVIPTLPFLFSRLSLGSLSSMCCEPSACPRRFHPGLTPLTRNARYCPLSVSPASLPPSLIRRMKKEDDSSRSEIRGHASNR